MSLLRHWKTVLGLLVVFVAGVAIGGIGTVRIVMRVHADKMNSANWTPRTLAWLKTEAQLTPEQESLARPSVEKMTHELIDLRTEAEARRDQVIGEMLVDVGGRLTPEQQERLKAAVRKKERSVPAGK